MIKVPFRLRKMINLKIRKQTLFRYQISKIGRGMLGFPSCGEGSLRHQGRFNTCHRLVSANNAIAD